MLLWCNVITDSLSVFAFLGLARLCCSPSQRDPKLIWGLCFPEVKRLESTKKCADAALHSARRGDSRADEDSESSCE